MFPNNHNVMLYNNITQFLVQSVNAWILFLISLLLVVPTAYQGNCRRLDKTVVFDGPTGRFVLGFLCGFSFYLASVTFRRLLEF